MKKEIDFYKEKYLNLEKELNFLKKENEVNIIRLSNEIIFLKKEVLSYFEYKKKLIEYDISLYNKSKPEKEIKILCKNHKYVYVNAFIKISHYNDLINIDTYFPPLLGLLYGKHCYSDKSNIFYKELHIYEEFGELETHLIFLILTTHNY